MILVGIIIVLLIVGVLLTLPGAPSQEMPAVQGSIIVGFVEGTTREQVDSLVTSFGLTWYRLEGLNWTLDFPVSVHVDVPIGEEAHWIGVFEAESIVKYAHEEVVVVPT